MRRKHKGFSLLGAVIIALCAVAVGAVVWMLFGRGGFGFGGGKGDGEGNGERNTPESSAAESVTTATTALTTEQITYIEVTVSGNTYLFQSQQYTDPDALLHEIRAAKAEQDVPVRITDDGASLNAYNKLKDALRAEKIRFLESE